MTNVTVTAFPRLHLGLLDMGGITAAQYGGAGLCLSSPPTLVSAEPTERNVVRGLEEESRGDLVLRALDRLTEATGISATIVVGSCAPAHMGFGSTTSLVLASLTGAVASVGVDVNEATLKRLSHRGGASGIGLNGFFTGGFLVDGGHRGNSPVFDPSEFRVPSETPAVRVRLVIPDTWAFHLILPEGTVWTPQSEREFFHRNTPIPAGEVHESVSLVYHSLVPSMERSDLAGVSRALARLHEIGFKRREVLGQTPSVRAALDAIRAMKIGAVGMSSMGPLVYVITDKEADPEDELRALCGRISASYIGSAIGVNRPREVRQ